MRHEGGMINQSLDAAQAFRERKEMRVLKETPCALEIGFQNHCDHAAEAAHLGAGEVVLWMRLEPGIKDGLDVRLFLQPARDLDRVPTMPFHPQRERFQTAHHEKTIDRSRHGA